MFEQTNYESILVDLSHGVLTVTLNRPDRANSFNNAVIRDFRRLWDATRESREVRCVVLRAAEGKAFCTGVDVREGWRAPGTEPEAFDYDDPGDWLVPKATGCGSPSLSRSTAWPQGAHSTG